MTTTPPAPPPKTLRARAAAAGDKVPTKWLFTGVLVLFLAASAAFGGLNDVPPAPLPVVPAGESIDGAQLRIAVDRAVLIDGFPEDGIVPAEGERLLVVVAIVENLWDEPASAFSDGGVADNLRPVGVAGLDESSRPVSVAVLSDGTEFEPLQPGVPVELAFIWSVDPAAVPDTDTLDIRIYDKVYRAEGFVTYGERFDSPFVMATSAVPLSDVGAGATS